MEYHYTFKKDWEMPDSKRLAKSTKAGVFFALIGISLIIIDFQGSNSSIFSLALGIINILMGIYSIYVGRGNKPMGVRNNEYLKITSKGVNSKFGFSKKTISKDEIHSISCSNELLTVKIKKNESVHIRLENIRNKRKLEELKEYVKTYQNNFKAE